MRGIARIATIGLALFLYSQQVSAQCRTYGRNTCEKDLEDYLLNGRMYGGYMVQGQETELFVVLSAGQKYRLVGCTKPSLGNVWIQLLDGTGRVIFDNSEHNLVQKWDFTVKATQEFKIRTFIPDPRAKTAQPLRDCSIMLIGSKSAG